jgi:hypothetical protein
MGGVIKIIQFIAIWGLIAVGTQGYGLILFPLYYWLVFVGGRGACSESASKAAKRADER